MYFGMPQDDVRLLPASESPVLQRVGIERRVEDADAPTMNGWRTARVRYVWNSTCIFAGYKILKLLCRTYGLSDLKKSKEVNVEEEYIQGIVVKHYN